MASSSSSAKKITLKSSDGETFEIEEAVALKSQTIKHLIDDVANDNTEIPISNVTGNILAKVIEYCKKHVDAANSDAEASKDELKNWDDELVKVDDYTLFNIILAANYLDIKSLLDLSSMSIADNIKDKTVEEVRKIFNIENDFTPEEEAEVRQENEWAFN